MIGVEPKIMLWELLGACECDSEAGHTWENRKLEHDLRRRERTVLPWRWAVPFLQGFLD